MLSESDLKWCQKLLITLGSARNRNKSMFFNGPVIEALPPGDWEVYKSVVAQPKDLRTMSEDLAAGKYSSVDDFIADAVLCFDNAVLFNKQRFPHVASAAESLKKVRVATDSSANARPILVPYDPVHRYRIGGEDGGGQVSQGARCGYC